MLFVGWTAIILLASAYSAYNNDDSTYLPANWVANYWKDNTNSTTTTPSDNTTTTDTSTAPADNATTTDTTTDPADDTSTDDASTDDASTDDASTDDTSTDDTSTTGLVK